MTVASIAALLLAGACGGTLEDDYRRGKIPGKPVPVTPAPGAGSDSGGALGGRHAPEAATGGATMAKVPSTKVAVMPTNSRLGAGLR